MDLSQEEFLRFLNCRVVLNKDQFVKETVLDANNKPVTIVKQHGKFQSHKVKLDETAINNKIVRIPLPRIKLADVNTKQAKNIFEPQKTKGVKRSRNVSSYGRKIKHKKLLDCFVSDKVTASSVSSDDSEIISVSRPTPTRRKNTDKISESTPKQSVEKQKNGAIIKSDILPTIISVTTRATPQKDSTAPRKINKKPKAINELEAGTMSEPSYYLQFPKTTYPVDGRLNYKFEELILDIKNMELPSPEWKIKVVIRKNKIASIIFTNKCQPERSVAFSAKSPYFYITIDNRAALLLGSPQTVDAINDIEVLLNIVHNIDAHNSMIMYKK